MVVLAAGTWGTWSLFLRHSTAPASVFGLILFLVMGLVPLPVALRKRGGIWDKTTVGLILVHGVFDALNVLAFFAAINHTTVALAVLTHYLAPILIAAISPYVDKTATRATGAAMFALAGLVIILEPWRSPADGALVGAALGASSALCYAGNVLALRPLIARIGGPAALSYHSLVAAAICAPLAAGSLGALTSHDLGWIVAGALIPGVVAGFLFNAGLGRIGSARTAVLTFAEPLVAVAIGALVWGEDLHPLAALGGALVLGAGIHVARKAR